MHIFKFGIAGRAIKEFLYFREFFTLALFSLDADLEYVVPTNPKKRMEDSLKSRISEPF